MWGSTSELNLELLNNSSSPERNFPEIKITFDKDVHVCVAAFVLWRVISLTCDIHCGFGKVILKRELKEKWSWVDRTLPHLMGRNWASKGWGAKRWRGAWGYGDREVEVHIWSLLQLKGILSPFLWIWEIWVGRSWFLKSPKSSPLLPRWYWITELLRLDGVPRDPSV